jgi:hypothetical protein
MSKGQVKQPDEHLDSAEMEQASRFLLDEDRAEHLTRCRGCQQAVAWERMARLGQLWDLEIDWPHRVYVALEQRAREKGNGLVYAVVTRGFHSKRARLPFEKKVNIILNIKELRHGNV